MKTQKFKLAIIPLLIITLTACGKNKNGSVPENQKEIHIRVWESKDGIDEFIKQAGKEYTKLHPNVIVDFINVELHGSVAALEADSPKGTAADIIASAHDTLGTLVSKNLILQTRNPNEISKKVLKSCAKALTYNGKMYGYPASAETYALFYNKKLIREHEVPKSWNEMIEWSKKFKESHPNQYSFVMDVTSIYYSIIFATANGNRLYGESGTEARNPYMNTKDAIRGMEFFQSLRNELELGDTELSTSSCEGLFASGNAAMFITGLWNVKPFENAGLDFGVAPIPSLPGESKPAASFSGTRGMFVTAASKHPDEAADFLEFTLSPEMQQLRFKLTGAMPSINTTVNSKYMAGFLQQLEYAFPMPSIPAMGKMWSETTATLSNIWNGNDVTDELNMLNEKIKG